MSIDYLKRRYPAGTRIRLIEMAGDEDYRYGDEGTVTSVDDAGQIHMRWDKGGSLAIIPEEDRFEVIG